MIVKVVSLFLIGILVLAMFGKLRAPKIDNPFKSRKPLETKKCPKCGSYILGDGPCACDRQG
jgi:hypothetical protein